MSRRYCLSALVASFGAGIAVAVILQLDVSVLQFLQAPAPQPEPVPALMPAPPEISAVAVTPVPESGEAIPEPRVAHPEQDFAEDPVAALQRMEASCAFWTQRATDKNGHVFRDRACSEMRQYAARTGQRTPKIGAGSRAATRDSRSAGKKSPLYVRECTEHRQGSITYRRCRAQESQRLKERCQYHRQSEQWAEAAGWCAAYESYQVID